MPSESGPDGPSVELSRARTDIDLWGILAILRRHWILICVPAVVLTLGGVVFALNRPSTYSTHALVQKLTLSSPLSSPTLEIMGDGLPPDAMASEVELLKSEAVLAPALMDLALHLRLPGNAHLRSGLLGGASVDSGVIPGSYTIRRRGDRLELLDEDGRLLASAAPGETLQGEGFRLPVNALPEMDGDVELQVRSTQEALERLRGDLSVVRAENTNLIRIGYTAGDPEFSAAVVNRVAQSYLDRAAAEARIAATRRREFLQEQLVAVADSVRQAQNQLARFQEESRLLDPSSEGETLAASLREQELRVRELRYRQGLLQSLVGGLSSPDGTEGLERIVTLSEDMVPGAQRVYTRLRELQDERRRMTADRVGYRETSSRVAVLDSLIQGARNELRILAEESLDLTGTRLEEARNEAATLREEVGRLPRRATAIGRLEQNAESILSTFALLSERYYEAQIAEAVASADVEIVDYARAPTVPDERNVLFPVVLAAILGLGGGVLGALIRESVDRTVHRSGDAEAATGLPVLAMIPQGETEAGVPARGLKSDAPPLLPGGEAQGGPVAEAFRALPSIIRYARVDGVRVVAVSSQGPQEGKSFTAANLALAMGRTGSRTLLVDCDLHRPSLHGIFGFEQAPGLSDLLTRQAAYPEVVREVEGASLRVLPAGHRAPDPGQLLHSEQFRSLIERTRSEFDAVILDTPPVLAVSDTLELAGVSDGLVLVVRAEETDRFALESAAKRLRSVQAPLLGVVLNGVAMGTGYGRRGNYYYRYHAYDYRSS